MHGYLLVQSPIVLCACVGDVQAVVATEETIRGTDFMWLDTVFLMNIPRSTTEYLHMCGRVGRLGQTGQAMVIVDSKNEIRRIKKIYSELNVCHEEIDINHC